MKDIGGDKRDPSPSPESQRVLERSGIFFIKNGIVFLQEHREYAKLKITYFVLNDMCEHTKFTWIGYFKKFINGDIDYINRYRCDDCGCEWMED